MTKLAFLIVLFPTICFSQTVNTTTKSGQRNIYTDALRHFITFASKSDMSIYDTLLVLKDDLLTDSLQPVIVKTNIVLIDSTEMSNRLKLDELFVAHKIFPLDFDNGHFYVNIVPFIVRKYKNEIALVNTGTCFVSYLYDSKKKSFKFFNVACKGF